MRKRTISCALLERGFDISGMDLSEEMLAKLKQKAPGAKVIQTDILQSETMDFQTHLYRYGEMEKYLRECGFENILTYARSRRQFPVNFFRLCGRISCLHTDFLPLSNIKQSFMQMICFVKGSI